jgi:hypothetical protein
MRAITRRRVLQGMGNFFCLPSYHSCSTIRSGVLTMFSTFTTDDGKLIVRAVDIRSLQDTPKGCKLTWDVGTSAIIHGTAAENMDRLRQEETDALIAAEQLRQRQQRPEVQRGRQSLRMRA